MAKCALYPLLQMLFMGEILVMQLNIERVGLIDLRMAHIALLFVDLRFMTLPAALHCRVVGGSLPGIRLGVCVAC